MHRKKHTKIARLHPALRKYTDCRLFFTRHNLHTFLLKQKQEQGKLHELQTERICNPHLNLASQRHPLSDALKTDPTGALASASGGGAFSNVDKINRSLLTPSSHRTRLLHFI